MKLFVDDKKATRNAYIWVTAVSIVNCLEAVVILMVVNRTVGLVDAGILTIAFTLANLFNTISRFEVISFQVTDTKRVYSFKDYIKARKLSFFCMLVVSFIYLMYGYFFIGYEFRKCIIILGVIMLHASESVEDVYAAEYQKNNRLDVGSIIAFIRWTISIGIISLTLILTKNTMLSVWIGACTSWIIMIFLVVGTKWIAYENDRRLFSGWKSVFEILVKCFPLFFMTFITFYITNAARYSIDRYMLDSVQACYGFVAMPVFAVTMISHVALQPQLVNLSNYWNNNEKDILRRKVILQLLIILVISLVCILGAGCVGIPILQMIYGVELVDYKKEMLILLSGGCFLAIGTYLKNLITIIRVQGYTIIVNAIVGLISLVFTKYFVINWGTLGASLINTFWIALLSIGYGCIVLYGWKSSR